MVQLNRHLRLVLYDNGLVAKGLECLLIPRKELPKDDALQWHLERKITRAESRRIGAARILISDILATAEKSGSWVRLINPRDSRAVEHSWGGR
jgi:hypothetical protein